MIGFLLCWNQDYKLVSQLPKMHEVDVPAACGFNIPASLDSVHAGIGHDLKQLPQCYLIFLYLSTSLIKITKLHSLHKHTQKENRISAEINISTSSGT